MEDQKLLLPLSFFIGYVANLAFFANYQQAAPLWLGLLMGHMLMHYFGEKNTYNYLSDRFNDGFFQFFKRGYW